MKIKYFDYDLCASCGGNCCQSHSGQYIPDDFKETITTDFIVGLLATGKFAIDWMDGNEDDENLYYLRPRHVNEEAVVGSWGGVCVNYDKSIGCTIEKDKRPFGCKKLMPSKDMDGRYNCISFPLDKADKWGCAKRWTDYQVILFRAIETWRNLNKID